MGIDPTDNLPAADAENFAQYAEMRLERAWNFYDWDDVCAIEERFFRYDYAAGTTYAEDDEVYDPTTDIYYISLQDANTGNDITDTDWWEPVTTLDKYISQEQTGQTIIGNVLHMWDSDPRIYSNAATLNFWKTASRYQVAANYSGTSVFIYFRKVPPCLTSVEYSAVTTYAAGDVAYSSGNVYKSLVGSNIGNAVTDTDYWEVVEFPKIFKHPVIIGAYADALEEDEQTAKAAVYDSKYNEFLSEEMERLSEQEGQHGEFSVRPIS